MEIRKVDNTISFDNDLGKILIRKFVYDDICFECDKDNTLFEINNSRDYKERQVYDVFRTLIFEIAGNYALDEYKDNLPIDFMDFDNRIITWHSDGEKDNILKLTYSDEKILLEIIKDIHAKDFNPNRVRIRTDGSDYSHYFEHFNALFDRLSNLTENINELTVKNMNSAYIDNDNFFRQMVKKIVKTKKDNKGNN